MKFLVVAASFLAPTLVSGQIYGAPPPAVVTPTPSPTPGQHIITVASGNSLTFSPSSVTANINETVTFLFSTQSTFNHSVSQSSFSAPCTKLKGGFDTGLQPPGQQFTITITNASEPIWFFCEQTVPEKHCGTGMVGVINPPASGDTFSSFSAAAVSIGNNEITQTPSLALIGAGASASAAPSAQPGSNGAEQLWVGVGTLLCALFGFIITLV